MINQPTNELPSSTEFIPMENPVVTPEVSPVQPEQNERPIEQPQDTEQPTQTQPQQTVTPIDTSVPVVIPAVKDKLLTQIESIMSSGLVDAFKEMSPAIQQQFKIKGEQAAEEIKTLLTKTKIKVKKIFKVLVQWLQIIPGINKYFIQQEAKIKADKLASLEYHPQLLNA